MVELQGCIELVCCQIIDLLGEAEPEAVLTCHHDGVYDLEAVGADIAALAHKVKILRRRQAQGD